MKRLVTYFVQGLVILVPIALTFWLLFTVFMTLDEWTRAVLPGAPRVGTGIAAMVLLCLGVGFLGSHFFTRHLVAAFERLLDRLPVVKMLHRSLRDLMSAFVGPERRFDRPVAVELTGGVRALGFVTRDSMAGFARADEVAVYFPQAYNFAGQVLLAPRNKVEPLEVPSADVMAFIVSGGVSGKPTNEAKSGSRLTNERSSS